MRVTYKNDTTTFFNIDESQCFEYNGECYMRTKFTKEHPSLQAVNLRTGELVSVDDSLSVTLYRDAKVVLE